MSSQSESEGEIIETENEKATTAQPAANGPSVDRNPRHITPDSYSSRGSHDDRHGRYRSRSRSPYRAKSPRGEKRRRDEDYYGERDRHDSRRFKVRYEDRDQRGDSRRLRVSYADIDRNHFDRDQRSRTRSRSPYRHDKRKETRGVYDKLHSRNDRYDKHGRDHRGRDRRGDGSSRDQSSRTRDKPAPAFVRESRENGDKDVKHRKGVSFDSTAGFEANTSTEISQAKNEAVIDEPATEPAIVDEAALIEERRKRREAIKAKFKGQSTPLLVQALQLGSQSGSATPKAETPGSRSERSVSPVVASPATPKHDSAPDSPTAFEVQDDQELANHNQEQMQVDEADGPSAADYDPTMDMQEDRAREDKRHSDDQAAASYDETKEEGHEILTRTSPGKEEKPAKVPTSDFDMFADEDDDDMFAPEPKAKAAAAAAPSKTVPIAPIMSDTDLDLRDNWDDPDGYYRFNPRDALDGRYRPQTNLGRGMFSAVFRALDIKSDKKDKVVAVKIIRNNETMRKAGFKEIDILKKLAAADPDDKKHIIRLVSHFEHKQHLCMVFENLSMNLREVLKKFGRDVGINLKAVRPYAQQMFLGLSLLKKCNILHADIKPDNILVNESRNVLKICDLGSAGDASENEITPYLVSRFYRAPEIILGLEYGFPIDMWSIGCTLFELYTGKILFTGRTNNQMLKSIMECRGKFSSKMVSKAEFGYVHFDDRMELFRSVEKDKVTGKDVVRMINFQKPTRDLKSRVLASSKGLIDADLRELNLFIDLLDRCLQLNPERRCTPSEALKHPFILRSKS